MGKRKEYPTPLDGSIHCWLIHSCCSKDGPLISPQQSKTGFWRLGMHLQFINNMTHSYKLRCQLYGLQFHLSHSGGWLICVWQKLERLVIRWHRLFLFPISVLTVIHCHPLSLICCCDPCPNLCHRAGRDHSSQQDMWRMASVGVFSSCGQSNSLLLVATPLGFVFRLKSVSCMPHHLTWPRGHHENLTLSQPFHWPRKGLRGLQTW